MRIRVVVRRTAASAHGPAPSRARASLQALGLGLPVLGVLGRLLSLWIFAVPRFQDLTTLRGDVARTEIVRPRRGSSFALITLADGDVLHVQRVRAVPGAVEGIQALRRGDAITAWIEPHEIERPHHHIAWHVARGNEVIVEFGDVIGPLERERGRFRIFCWTVLVGGLLCLAAGAIRPGTS